MTVGTHRHTQRRAAWLVPVVLILLSLIPILAGAARLTELTGGATVTALNERFFASPVPVVTHIVSVTVFAVLGAFQFVASFRRRRWHRLAGRLLVPVGLAAALSGLWMAAFYPHPPGDGILVLAFRLVFGAAMVACLILGLVAALRRRYARHSEWMTRAYAIGVAAGTQALVLIPGVLLFGATHELSRGLLMGSAWLINLAVAEWVIRRRRSRSLSPRPVTLYQTPLPSGSPS